MKYMYFSLVLCFILFFLKAVSGIDPDFGWHLKMGELIVNEGIPATDPFTYTMPSFPYVDHSWLADVFLYLFYSNFGYKGLAIIFSFINITTLWLVIRQGKKFPSIALSLLLLAASVMISIAGIRIQEISWLMFAGLLIVLSEAKTYHRIRYLIPLQILLWANLHGSFPFGLLLFGLFVISKSIDLGKAYKEGIVILFLCLTATFINPYGAELWREVLMIFQDFTLRFLIAEWLPSFIIMNFPYLVLGVLGITVLSVVGNKIKFFKFAVFIVTLLMSISGVRHVPYFTISASLLIITSFKELPINQLTTERLNIASKYFMIGALFVALVQISMSIYNWHKGFDESKYPGDAIRYLQNNVSGNVFNTYNWGGYLIWKYPQNKVFIDGRAPIWKWNHAPVDESDFIMRDYTLLSRGQIEIGQVVQQYELKAFILPRQIETTQFNNAIVAIMQQTFFGEYKASLYEQLESSGWEVTYADDVALVYEKI